MGSGPCRLQRGVRSVARIPSEADPLHKIAQAKFLIEGSVTP